VTGRQIRRLALGLLVLFLALFAQINYIQVFAADELADNNANAKRQLIAEYAIDRGSIVASDGRTVLAASRKSAGELKYQRRYPQGPLYATVTGFYSFVYGKTGLEFSFDEYLNGEASELLSQTLVDQILGRPKRGGTVVSTIDPAVQRAAATALGSQPGAVVAIEPSTGYVRALYANPTYDPNELSSQDEQAVRAAWKRLNADPDKPLVSRAVAELFPPGSTFKVVTSAAALENGYAPSSPWPNPHELDLPQTTATIQNFGGYTCPGGSQITLAQALMVSCNVVFGEIGLALGPDGLADQAHAFGFVPDLDSNPIPFDIRFQEGFFPDPSYFADREPAVAISAIGQDQVAANPMQMALVAAAVGNRGVQMRPRLVQEIRDQNGQVVQTFEPEEWGRPLSTQSAAQLTAMMVSVVESGTGQAARIPGVQVAGKTGTAQHAEGENPHAWFVCFAPADNPEIAVAVVVLNGGNLGSEATGGQVAAPIARAVLEAALS
jgi:peptidoglycan glycosyltransferase